MNNRLAGRLSVVSGRILSVFSSLLLTSLLCAQSDYSLWKRLEQAERKDMPQTVMKIAGQIYRKAKRNNDMPHMLKAYMYRTKYQQMLTPDSFYVHLNQLEEMAKQERRPVERAILHSLLAGVYADYAHNNIWELNRRDVFDAGESGVPADIREWSRNLFVERVIRHTNETFSDINSLYSTSSSLFSPFVLPGNIPAEDKWADMYQTLSVRAIDMLRKLEALDDDCKTALSISHLYNETMRIYGSNGGEIKQMLATLDYLRWRRETELKLPPPYESLTDEDYIAALDTLTTKYGAYEICAEAYLQKARTYLRMEKHGDALRVCEEALDKYPAYRRVEAFMELRDDILHPQLTISADKVAYPSDSLHLHVSHCNLDGFTVNIYRASSVVEVDERAVIDSAFYEKHATFVRTVRVELKRPANFRVADTVCAVPVPAEPGLYVFRYVPDGVVADDKQAAAEDAFFVRLTHLKLLNINLGSDGCEMAVLDARSGQPVAGARVRLYPQEPASKERVREFVTSSAGRVMFSVENGYYKIEVNKGDDVYIVPRRYFIAGRGLPDGGGESYKTYVRLLTDRSLYRPGQTIHVKGVAYGQQGDETEVLANRNYEVVLYDANSKEAARRQVRTNEYGSFALQFVLPQTGLNGDYLIEATGEGKAQSRVRVEEYKRPTFEVLMDEPETGYKAGDSINVTGKAVAFSGVVQQGAKLSYTVSRTSRYWWGGYGGLTEQLSSGNLTVDENGRFVISVLLAEAGSKHDGYHTYSVDATVTNAAGETQTATLTLPVGERSVILSVSKEELFCKDKEINLTFKAYNLKSQPVALEGRYRLIRHSEGKETECLSGKFVSNVETSLPEWGCLPSGKYELRLTARDEQERPIEYKRDIILFSSKDTRPPAFTDIWFHAGETTFDVSHPARFAFGTSHKDAYVLMDVFSNGKRIKVGELQLTDSIVHFEVPYKEEYGDGMGYLFTFVKNGKVFTREVKLTRALPDRNLTLKWKVFRDKLRPGQSEEWKLTVTSPDGEAADAEMLATLYDASLDKLFFRAQSLKPFYGRNVTIPYRYGEYAGRNYYVSAFARTAYKVPELAYSRFCDIADSWAAVPGVRYTGEEAITRSRSRMYAKGTGEMSAVASSALSLASAESLNVQSGMDEQQFPGDVLPEENFRDEARGVRSDFSETAFFYPQLRTGEDGEISLSFTVPESLTRWNFCGYAHSKHLFTGEINASVVTVKEFMLSPNMPRFVRVGDETSVAATVVNLTGKRVRGYVRFELFEPETDKVIATQRKTFGVGGGETAVVNFTFKVADTHHLLGVRMVASGDGFSDGEQHLLPVLSDKEYIIETLTLPIRGGQEKTFSLDKLFNGDSPSATNRQLTVEFTGNPAWYAVQALPVLANPQYDDAMSWISAYYANSLAAYVVDTQPRMRKLLEYWRARGAGAESFGSRLEQNRELKSTLLSETPWVADANTDRERQERLVSLFDRNNFENNRYQALAKLKELQGTDGSWSWYKGMPGSSHVTEYVCLLLNRLSALTGTKETEELKVMRRKAFVYLHNEAMKVYRSLQSAEKAGEKNVLLPDRAIAYLYLWAVSGEEIPGGGEDGVRFLLSKVSDNLKRVGISRKAKSAIILHKAGRQVASEEFINSIKEYLTRTEEDGAFFAFNETPYRWGMHDVSVQVDVMEALSLVGGHDELVEEMKLWLLKQKKNTDWRTSVATSDAVYALLCRGTDLLSSRGDVSIRLGNRTLQTLQPAKTTVPDMGYLKENFTEPDAELKAKSVVVEKRDEGMAWGAVYARYLSPVSDVKSHGTGLSVNKKLYVERMASNGKKALFPVDSSTILEVGEKVVARLTIQVSTAMDFVHLKDKRGACFEPEQALSGYRWNSGIAYYVEPKDAATNFFFTSLGKGVHVLEYAYRVARTGTYEAGLAVMQCMYAPEYVAYAGSMKIKVGERK